MLTELRPLEIRRRLGRQEWAVPVEFGANGWRFEQFPAAGDAARLERRILVSVDDFDGARWIHASISVRDVDVMPTYEDLTLMHRAVWPAGHAYQCFVPPADHVNIRANALHLWGRADGARVLPAFGMWGTI